MDSALASGANGTGSTPVRRTSFASSRLLYMRRKVVGVIGGRNCSPEVQQQAYDLGRGLVGVADTLVTGGLGGTMEAVTKGFKSAGGLTIGIIPGYEKDDANPYVDIVIPTGLGLARNVLVVKSADVVIAFPGKSGTLSEIAYCLQFGIPVISFNPLGIFQGGREPQLSDQGGSTSWDIKGVIKIDNAEDVIKEAKRILEKSNA
jgi:uncharacterized protein (TIGR00725 family)